MCSQSKVVHRNCYSFNCNPKDRKDLDLLDTIRSLLDNEDYVCGLLDSFHVPTTDNY